MKNTRKCTTILLKENFNDTIAKIFKQNEKWKKMEKAQLALFC